MEQAASAKRPLYIVSPFIDVVLYLVYNSTMLSGKFVLRIDPKMHKSLKEEAKEKGESLNALCLSKISQSSNLLHASALTAIITEFSPRGVVLFGSAARGEARASSDIDLLIVLEDSTPIDRDLYKRWDKIMGGNSKYSPQFVHLPSVRGDIGSLWLECSIEGEILFDREYSLKNELVRIRSQIADGHYQRKLSHGHAYWIKKESYAE